MRKTTIVKIVDDGHELEFRISQMPATRLEFWLIRVGALIAGTGLLKIEQADSSDQVLDALVGMILTDGLKCLGELDFEKIRPLIDELYTCVEHKVENAYSQVTAENIDGKISSVKSLFELQKEVIKFNLGFFTDVGASTSDMSSQSVSDRRKPRISRV